MSLKWYLRLYAHLLASKLKRIGGQRGHIGEEATDRGLQIAQEVIQNELFEIHAADLDKHFSDDVIRSIEIQFLWGFFHEFVQEYKNLPTNGFDRIKIHLMYYITTVNGYKLSVARDTVNSVEDLFNEETALFEAIADLGKQTYHDRSAGRIAFVLQTILDKRKHPS